MGWKKRPKKTGICDSCNEEKQVITKRNGQLECLLCNSRAARDKYINTHRRICSLCLEESIIFAENDDKFYCQNCYRNHIKNKNVCFFCNEKKISYFNKKIEKFYCSNCHSKYIRGKKVCSICNEEGIVNKYDDGKPICSRCYHKNFYEPPTGECYVCHKIDSLPVPVDDQKRICRNCDLACRRKNDAKFNIIQRLRSRLSNAFRIYSKNGKVNSSKEYGIDYQAIFEYIGECPGNRKDYHIDHIKPLCLFDFDDPEQVKEAYRADNHQWMLASENIKKGCKYIEPVLGEEDKKNE